MNVQPQNAGGYGSPQQQKSVYSVAPQRYQALTRGHKRTSRWAGVVGLNLMSLGASVIIATILVSVVIVIFARISSSAAGSSGLRGFDEVLGQVAAPLVFAAVGLIGAVIFVVGMLSSVAILRAGEVHRPWAITWSAFAISIPVLWVVNTVSWVVGQVVQMAGVFAFLGPTFGSGFAGEGNPGLPFGMSLESSVVIAAVGLLVAIIVIGVIGALAWWWMAHAFRVRVPVTGGGGD